MAMFWVKAYDVLGLKQTSSFAKFLGNNVAEFMGCDEDSMVEFYRSISFKSMLILINCCSGGWVKSGESPSGLLSNLSNLLIFAMFVI